MISLHSFAFDMEPWVRCMDRARGQLLGLCHLLYLFAYIFNVFEWMEPSDARLILFHTSLDTAADLRSRSKIEFLHL